MILTIFECHIPGLGAQTRFPITTCLILKCLLFCEIGYASDFYGCLVLRLLAIFCIQVHLISSEGDLTIKMKLHSLKIKDELQGRLSARPQYLACSVLRNSTTPSVGDPVGDIHEDDDTFTDALPEFAALYDSGDYSRHLDTPRGSIGELSGSPAFGSAEDLINEQDPIMGRNISSEIFYEAEGGNYSDFVSVVFSTRSPTSQDYDGIDTQVFSLHMISLFFFFNLLKNPMN